jgi:hypothetical protein
MSIDWWQTRDASTREYRDVTAMDIAHLRNRARERASTTTRFQMSNAPGLDRKHVFAEAFRSALAAEVALLKA